MAAEVSRQIKTESSSKSCLATRDFLGAGAFGIESKELDLDLHVPSGWEKRLDLKSGKVYIQRCNSTNDQRNNPKSQKSPKFQGLLHPSNINPTLALLEDTNLDLKLVSNCSPSSYTSVCTLDKVKSALDRAERTSASSSSSSKRRWMIRSPSSSVSNSSSVSMKDGTDPDDEESRVQETEGLVAAACPSCLLYVLISKSDPKCPKCNSFVQMPLTKKLKIDLNISI